MKYIFAFSTILLLTAFAFCKGENKKSDEAVQSAAIVTGDTVPEIGKNIRCVFQDKENVFWFATDGEGVFRYDGSVVLQLTEKHGLCSRFVWLISQSTDGTMLFNTRDGVCSFDGKQIKTLQPVQSKFEITNFSSALLLSGYYYQNNTLGEFQLSQNSPLTNNNNYHSPYAVYCSFRDSKGNIWFGTDSRGVCKFDGLTYTWLDDKELGVAVRSIFEDKNGNIWIGNNGYGLFRYDGKTLTNFTREHKLENPDFLEGMKTKEGTLARVWTITEDKLGNLWIGTIDAGLWKYDGQTLINYTTLDGLTGNSVWTVFCDNNGVLWIGTDGDSMTRYDGKAFTAFTGRK